MPHPAHGWRGACLSVLDARGLGGRAASCAAGDDVRACCAQPRPLPPRAWEPRRVGRHNAEDYYACGMTLLNVQRRNRALALSASCRLTGQLGFAGTMQPSTHVEKKAERFGELPRQTRNKQRRFLSWTSHWPPHPSGHSNQPLRARFLARAGSRRSRPGGADTAKPRCREDHRSETVKAVDRDAQMEGNKDAWIPGVGGTWITK